ncbi:DNA polymerase Y family protein [Ideonella sp.]|uniref:Y-family DNA polymerase n=1 Tax=Ideonella sp. TaxID=1929293 RepID=UPI002B4A979A|nr:DNA polymerase Y family protein [Ideonella sp.]HJV71638.1 DNA polymerase Y family protein [Ideonella sp.]
MLWIGLHLPLLSLEAFCARMGAEAALPVALQEQHRIVAANAAAAARGVAPGMKRATALALAPELVLGQADPRRDAEALQAVAHVLLAFTPTVVPAPPDGLLAEVQASLRCFGGPARLWQRIADALAPLGHRVQRAHAPSALGALLLARAQDDPHPPDALTRAALCPAGHGAAGDPAGRRAADDPAWAALHQRLVALPAAWLAPDEAACAQMEAMGLRTLADLRRQPRGGLARRFGPGVLSALDRAWGLAPDPLEPIAPPLRFHSQVELWARADNTDALLGGAQVLLVRLLAWAQARHARVQRFTLLLHHESRLRANSQGEAGVQLSRVDMALAEPTGDARHLQAVLRERLAREPLAAPVHTMGLACDEPVLGPPPDGELFPSQAGQREGFLRLAERLQARLGRDAVQRLAVHADHRPERATVQEDATTRATAAAPVPPGPTHRLTRPTWLLPTPQALPERASRPWLGGQPLHLLAGPERIETGWWDGDLVCRDYFVAQQHDGALLWVYRLRPVPPAGEPGWFLHGRFG